MKLTGISWDHPRGYNPLLPMTEEFCRTRPDVSINWDKRSLKDFGDYPIGKLVDKYDFIIIDHPFMPDCLNENLLVVLDDLVERTYLETLKADSVGPSFDSYYYKGKLQALPIDAACHTAASNPELMQKVGATPPVLVEDIFTLHQKLGGKYHIAFPFWPTDIACIFFNLVAQHVGQNYIDEKTGVNVHAGIQAAQILGRMAEIAQPNCYDMNPIDIYNEMAGGSLIAYCPYAFSYSNYSREGFRNHVVLFHDSPLLRHDSQASTMLGGVGIAISSRIASEKLPTALEYIRFISSPEIQKGLYAHADGQPATRSAWLDEENNRLTHNFFKNTLRTIELAYVRPKVPNWAEYHTMAGVQLQKDIQSRIDPTVIVAHINRLFVEMCSGN